MSSIQVHAQKPGWLWARQAGAGTTTLGFDVATDRSANVYVVGSYSHSIKFDTIAVNGFALTDMYIVKYDAKGKVIWAKTNGWGNRDDAAKAVVVDTLGNIYVAGYFQSTSIKFDTTVLYKSTPLSASSDIFLVKYNSSGDVVWAKSIGGDGNEEPFGISFDRWGNVHVAASFSSSAMKIGSSNYASNGGFDVLLFAYDPSGTLQWVHTAGGTADDEPSSLICDASGSVYVTGYYKSTSISFDAQTLTNSATNGLADIFLVKYTGSGSADWANTMGGSNNSDYSSAVVWDEAKNIYVTGKFYSSSFQVGPFTLSKAGSASDIFLSKYDKDGKVLWAKTYGNSGMEAYTTDMATGSGANLYFTGYFTNASCRFDTLGVANTTSGGNGVVDVFVLKCDSGGNAIWLKGAGGKDGNDAANAIALDVSENIYVIGAY